MESYIPAQFLDLHSYNITAHGITLKIKCAASTAMSLQNSVYKIPYILISFSYINFEKFFDSLMSVLF